MSVLRFLRYLCFPLWCDSPDVFSHYVANVELLQELGSLETFFLHELFDLTALQGAAVTKIITP